MPCSGLKTGEISHIMPGLYATVGAAAFSGAVTRTVSISVIGRERNIVIIRQLYCSL